MRDTTRNYSNVTVSKNHRIESKVSMKEGFSVNKNVRKDGKNRIWFP